MSPMVPSSRVLLVGDIHLLDRDPRSAQEGYVDDLLGLFAWCFDYAAHEGIRTVVSNGDLFHHKQPSRTSHALLLRVIPILQKAKKLGIEFLVVVGNHDVSNDVLESVREKQPLGILFEAGLATELTGWHPTLPLYGVPWQQRWMHEGVIEEAFDLWRSAGGVDEGGEVAVIDLTNALAVTHMPLFPGHLEPIYEAVNPAQVAAAMGHIGYVNYGHIHDYHGQYAVDGVIFENVGALSRGSADENNLNRDIKVVTWAASEGFIEVDVPHKPASEVFKIADIIQDRSEKLSRAAFLADIGNRTIAVASRTTVMSEIRSMDSVPKPVRERAVQILESVPGE